MLIYLGNPVRQLPTSTASDYFMKNLDDTKEKT